METTKERRKQYHYYVTSKEYEQIRQLAARVAIPEAAVVRICVLAVANTPILEYIFDDDVLLKADSLSLLKYSPTLRIINEAMKQLGKQGVHVDVSEFICKEMNWKVKKTKRKVMN